jgi:hypothetical protein
MSVLTMRHFLSLPIVRAVLIGLTTAVLFFAWESHRGFNLWDEGFLWYGVQRVMLGEIPIRDFQAYDPGRYYWSATLMLVTGGHGIMAVRGTILILQAAALVAALGLLTTVDEKRTGPATLALCALILGLWMLPRYKIVDMSLSIVLVAVLAWLVRWPSPRHHFLAGLTVGLIACVGRNHGLYGLAASFGVFVYLALRCEDWRAWRQGVLLFFLGLVTGYTPLLAMLLLVRGFAPAFIESIRMLFEAKATNLPLPVPWPWEGRFTGVPLWESAHQALLGVFFVALIVFFTASIVFVVLAKLKGKPVPPVLVASAFVALSYAHYSFARADAEHLALGIFPMLVGILAFALTRTTGVRWALVGVLLVSSWVAMFERHPGWQCRTGSSCELVSIGSDVIWMDPDTASQVSLLRRLKADFAPAGQSVFVAPLWPGAYALLGTKSPTWEIYMLSPKTAGFQRQEIARLAAARPAFALIIDYPLDGREELRYRNTHPLIEQYIESNFELVKSITTNPVLQVYRPSGG